MRILLHICSLGIVSLFSAYGGDEKLYDAAVLEKAKRNKIGDFIAVASISLDSNKSLSDSSLFKTLVGGKKLLVVPGGDVTLGIRTLWCAPEDFDAVSKWLRGDGRKYSEIVDLFDGKRYFFDRRDLKILPNKTK